HLRGFIPCRRREVEAGTADRGDRSGDEGHPPARKFCRQRSLTVGEATPPIRSITIVEPWAKEIGFQRHGIRVCASTGGDGKRTSIGIGWLLSAWWPRAAT